MLAGGVGCLLEILHGSYDSCCMSFDLEIRLESRRGYPVLRLTCMLHDST
jgi:hypothetical protein